MNQRRVTLSLDEDIIAFLKESDGSMSATANPILRKGLETEARLRALQRYFDERDERRSSPTPEEYVQAEDALDAAQGIEEGHSSAA